MKLLRLLPRATLLAFALLMPAVRVPAETGAAAATTVPVSELKATPLMTQETLLVIELLEKGHYSNRQLTEDDFKELLTQYMASLDGRRLFLLDADVKAFTAKNGDSLGERMRISGTIDPAFELFKTYRTRAVERFAWVQERLKGDFDLSMTDSIEIDRRKAAWPKDGAEADVLWEQRLRAELIELVLGDKSLDEAKETIRKRYERTSKTIEEIDAEEVQELFLTALMQVYDPHSTFFSAETMEDFSIGMRLSLTGIGALLGVEEEYCVVRELIAGGPAKLSGALKPNDKVVAVAQDGEEPVEVVGFKLRKVVNMIRGERGTKVTLTILPADARDHSERRQITLVRDTVHLDESRAKASVHEVPAPDGSSQKVGLISVPSFYGAEATEGRERVSVTDDVRALLRKLEPENVSAVVLDLRRNGGGLLTEAIELTGLFIPRGPVVQVRDAYDRRMVRSDERKSVEYAGPLVVLTDRYTASASEIVAGALQNYGRAVVVGSRSTHGKGTVQQIFDLRDYMNRNRLGDQPVGAAKLTVQKFYLPNGDSTQRQGVVPDIILPSAEDFMEIGEADLEHALPWDRIEASRFSPVALRTDASSVLRAAVEERAKLLPEFGLLRRSIEFYRKRQDEKTLSLNLEVRRQLRDSDKATTAELKAQGKDLEVLKYPTREILLDGVTPPEKPVKTAAAPAASESGATTASTESKPADKKDDSEEEDDETPGIDVHLREGLRIAADYSRYLGAPDKFAPTPVATALLHPAPKQAKDGIIPAAR